MTCHKLLQSQLLRHFHYLNQSRTYLAEITVCVLLLAQVSIHFQSLQSIATDDEKHYQYQIVLNNKTGPLLLEFEIDAKKKNVLAF